MGSQYPAHVSLELMLLKKMFYGLGKRGGRDKGEW
jgi:hypothetical protein